MASKIDIKSAKINLKVCRSQVTKAIKQFENSGQELNKNEQGTQAKKLSSMGKLGGSSTSLVNLSIILVITSIKAGNYQYDAGSYQIVQNLALLKNQC